MNPLLFAQLLQEQGLGGPMAQGMPQPNANEMMSPAMMPPERPDMRSEDPDFLRYSMMPLDERQAQLRQQIQAADALMKGGGQQHSTPLGAALGGLSDIIRMGVGASRQRGLDMKQNVLNEQRAEMIQQAGRGPSTLRYALPQQPKDTSIQQGYLENAQERERRLAEAARLKAEADAAKAQNAGLLAKTKAMKEADKAAAKAKSDVEKFETGLRKEILGSDQGKQWLEAKTNFYSLQNLSKNPTPADSMAIVFAAMKSVDPTSVVKEGEQVQVRNTASLPDRLLNYFNQSASGVGLNPQQIQEIVGMAQKGFAARSRTLQEMSDAYKPMVEQKGGNMKNVMPYTFDLTAPNPPEPKRGAATAPKPTPPAPAGVVGTGDPRNLKSKVTVGGKVYRTYSDGTVTIEDQ